MHRLKVMHVLCTSLYSGAENVAATIIEGLKDKADGIYVSPDGSVADILREKGIMHYPLKKVSVANVRKAIRDIRPDIIHAHGYRAGIVCSFAAGKTPVINHLHNNCPWMKKPGLKSFAYISTSFRYRRVLTVSESVMDEFVFGKLLRHKTFTIGNPINVSKIRKMANNVTANMQVPKSDIVFLGRLTLQKNPLFFVEIVKSLKVRRSNLSVAMIGDGELRGEVERKIKEYDLASCVTLYGFQTNPYPFVKAARVMCMPSLWEGFGLAAAEALSLGKPVLAAPVGGLTGIVDESCGKLCCEKDEYVAEILRLLDCCQIYEEKSEAAIRKADGWDSVDSYGAKLLNCYRQVLDDRERG